MSYDYDDGNVFARILRGEIPNDTVHETRHSLAFRDVRPQAPKHVLVIPKGAYVTFDHFAAEASDEELVDFMRAVAEVCRITAVTEGGADAPAGWRAIANAGEAAVQEVPHFHLHVLAGRPLGRMLDPA
jgi:histidine triad (HIT) family protein